jgi:hypothetical protein
MIEILCGLLRPSAVGASSDCGCAYEVLPGGVHPERRYFHEPDCPLVGASKPEPVRTEGGVPHPEALVRLYIHAHTQSPWRAEALEALDVLVGRLEQAERTVTNLEQAFTAAREDLKQKDEALREIAEHGEGNYITWWDSKRCAERAREALGVPPPQQDPGASRAGRSGGGA